MKHSNIKYIIIINDSIPYNPHEMTKYALNQPLSSLGPIYYFVNNFIRQDLCNYLYINFNKHIYDTELKSEPIKDLRTFT